MPSQLTTAERSREPRRLLAAARLCVLVDGGEDARHFENLVAGLVSAGVPLLQIRDKHLSDRLLLERVGQALAAVARQPTPRTLVVVNDRVDVAAAAGADGVHLGESDLPVTAARGILGSNRLIGRTAHDLAEADTATAAGADYLGVGPCFPSTTKAFAAQADRRFLAAAARLPLPVFAIGGIVPQRLPDLAALGIDRIAVAAAITKAADPEAAARAMIGAIGTVQRRA